MSHILVTGSAGFIGFHVANAVLRDGHRVIGVDNFTPYYYPGLKRIRHEMLAAFPLFHPVEADLADLDAVRMCVNEYRPRLVCHLAAQAGVRMSHRDPHAYQRANLQGFLNVIEEARLTAVERFVYASSSSVYGGNTKLPYSEDDPVNQPVSLYAAKKRANELISHTYTHLWDMQTVDLRFFTVYGEWGRPDMAAWSFQENILHDEPIQLFNYGANRRDFTYISDIVAGVKSALTSTALSRYEIINLGNHEPVEVTDFVKLLEDFAGKKAILELVPPEPGDVVATYADVARAADRF